MDEQTLRELIAGGESLTVEFKSDRGPLSDADLVETVVCLANGEGGTLLVGVEDDGGITSLHKRHRTSAGELAAFVASRTIPALCVEARFFELHEGQVAVLNVPMVRQPVSTSDGRLLVRQLDIHGRPSCRPLYAYELPAWQAERGALDVSALVVPDTAWTDLDPLEFARLRRLVEEYRGDQALLEIPDAEIARALGLVQEIGGALFCTLAGLLLVGKEAALREHVPAHEVAFQVLRGTDVAFNEFRRWPLLRILEWILEAFEVRNEERELNIGMFRVPVPSYDPRGFREAVNNALLHRDYQRLGAVHVQMHDSHVRISNPGGFVQGIRPNNLLVTDPKPRNPRLADAFKRIGLVERIGRGVAIIFTGQLRNGRQPPHYDFSTEVSVSIVLPGGPADLDFVELIITEENRRQRSLTVSELLILSHLWRERSIDTPTAARLIQQPDAAARSTLESLVESGLVEPRGQRKSRTYMLSAGVYREVGQPSAYIRARGFEAEQMEQMVLQYVRAYERITRREAADLCRIGPHQATRLLQRMVQAKKLQQHGRKKGTYYTIRS